jgi:hypothetical protein
MAKLVGRRPVEIKLSDQSEGGVPVFNNNTRLWSIVSRYSLASGSAFISGSQTFIGDQTISGSLTVYQGITGSLFGTASYASNTWVVGGNGFSDGTADRVLGTLSNHHLSIYANNSRVATFTNSGSLFIAPYLPNNLNDEKFLIDAGTTTSHDLIRALSDINSYSQINIQNFNSGSSASSDVIATANNGSEIGQYIDMGINSSTFSGSIGAANDAYLYSTGNDLHIGNASNSPIQFFAGGTDTDTNRKLQLNPNNLHQMTGSLDVSGSIVARSFTGSLQGTASYAAQALSSSYWSGSIINAATASYVLQAQSASYWSGSILNATSASFAETASSADNFLVRGTLTAQTIVAQTITSSTEFITGSTKNGSLLSNTHQFTGSVSITGSLGINGVDYTTISGSASTRLTALETFSGSYSTGSFTGSFIGRVTGSFSGSLHNLQNTVLGKIPFFSSSQVLADSVIRQLDNGTGSYSIAINQDDITTAAPEALYVYQPSSASYNVISGKGNLNNYLQLNIQNTNTGENASSDVVATANNGNESINFINMGINSEGFTGSIGNENDAYLYSTGNHLHIGNTSPNQPLGLFVGGEEVEVNRKLVLRPNNQHEVTGSLNVSGSIVAHSFTGSLQGTASWASNAVNATSASYALTASLATNANTASYVLNAISASYAATASNAPSYLPLAGGTMTGDIYAAGRSFTFQDLLLGAGTTFGKITTDGSKYISVMPTYNVESARFWPNGNVTIQDAGTYVDNGFRLDVSGSGRFTSGLTITGSFAVSGSTIQVGNNTLLGNTTLSGSIVISGSVGAKADLNLGGVLRLDPGTDPGSVNLTASFLFTSASNTLTGYDLYYRQNDNLVKFKWLEGGISTGLLYGGVITYSGSTIFVSKGSGIINNLNASTGSEISPIFNYVTWNDFTGSATYLTASQNTFIYVDDTGVVRQQPEYFNPDQFKEALPLGRVTHANYTSITGAGSNVQTSYDGDAQQNEFIRIFGPIKESGLLLSAQTGSMRLSIGAGQAYNLGGFYPQDPNHPSHYISSGFATASIARAYRSGSAIRLDNNNGAFYTTVDSTNWDDGTGVLNSMSSGDWQIQRVFVNPVTGRTVVYYGQAVYSTLLNALQYLSTDPFEEGEFTAKSLVFVGYLVVKGNTTNLADTGNNAIIQSGIFRGTQGSSGGAIISTTLDSLSDVNISTPSNGQALIYSSGNWVNGNPISASFALTASYISGSGGGVGFPFSGSAVITGSFLVSSSFVDFTKATYVTGSFTGSLNGNATSASYASYAAYAGNSPGLTVAFTQSVAATTWSFTHNLNTRNPLLQVYDSTYHQIVPLEIIGSDPNQATIYFDAAESGFAIASNGGTLTVNGSTARLDQTSTAVTWSFQHNLATRYPNFIVYDSTDNVVIPAGIHAISDMEAEIYFSFPSTGVAIANFSGISGSINTASSSYAQTSSYAVSASNATSASYWSGSILNATSASYAFNAVTASYLLGQSPTSSYALTASYVTTAQTASYVLNAVSSSYAATSSYGNDFIVGNTLTIDQSLTDYHTVPSSIVGSNNMFNLATGSYSSAFFKYTVANGANARTGEVMAVWNGGAIQFTDNSTVDIGDTSTVIAEAAIAASSIQFNITTATSGWKLKSLGTFM